MIQDVEFRPEIEAVCGALGMRAKDALRKCVALSSLNYVTYHEGKLIAYWGVQEHSVLGGVAEMWMLPTVHMDACALHAARECYRGLREMLARYTTIIVNADKEYERSVRWLQWLGFKPTIEGPRYIQLRIDRGNI